MAIKSKAKFGLQNLVSTPATESPDDLLLGSSTPETKPVESTPAYQPDKIRFTNSVPVDTFRRLHQLSFWSREDITDILDAALTAYFAQQPDADKPLPEKERVKRKLP